MPVQLIARGLQVLLAFVFVSGRKRQLIGAGQRPTPPGEQSQDAGQEAKGQWASGCLGVEACEAAMGAKEGGRETLDGPASLASSATTCRPRENLDGGTQAVIRGQRVEDASEGIGGFAALFIGELWVPPAGEEVTTQAKLGRIDGGAFWGIKSGGSKLVKPATRIARRFLTRSRIAFSESI